MLTSRKVLGAVGICFIIASRKPYTFSAPTEFKGDCKALSKVSISNPKGDGTFDKTPLYLVAVGMRRKTFLFINIDVYLVGISLSESIINKIQNEKNAFESTSLSKSLIKKSMEVSNTPSISVSMQFVRNIDGPKIVQAIADSFGNCSHESIAMLKSALTVMFGESGVKNGDILTYYWMRDKGIVMVVNGDVKQVISSPEIAQRMLEIYVDSNDTVSPELVENINKNLNLMVC